MKIFVAGASGALGRPVIAELFHQGHEVTGMTQSEAGKKRLIELGASVAVANAFDAAAVESALQQSQAEVVIDLLSALPKKPENMPSAMAGDMKLRLEGGGFLHRAAQACGVRRYIQQGCAFFLKAGDGLADESAALMLDASPQVAAYSRMYTELEERTLTPSPVEGVVLRYGFFYGPNTWYNPDGGAADQVRHRLFPLVGRAQGVWSFVHIGDAALATVAAVTAPPGVYNVVDDDPSPVNRWLPAFVRWVGAPPPRHVPQVIARLLAGQDAVYYSTKLCGASNGKAKRVLSFQPRRLQWLNA